MYFVLSLVHKNPSPLLLDKDMSGDPLSTKFLTVPVVLQQSLSSASVHPLNNYLSSIHLTPGRCSKAVFNDDIYIAFIAEKKIPI